MISTSNAYQKAIAENTLVEVQADLELADGTEVVLAGDDIMANTLSITQAVSSSSSFDIGGSVIGSLAIVLNNSDGRFDTLDFTGATIEPRLGKELEDGTVEWIRRGTFYIEQPSAYGPRVSLTALDAMSRFERPYSEVGTTYPASLASIVDDICVKCGVPLASASFSGGDAVVGRRPDDASLTCLAVLGYAAQMSGNWCRVSPLGELVVDWYDTRQWESEAWLDGGTFSTGDVPYGDGDRADGGDFDDYGSGCSADGGVFAVRSYATVHALSSLTVFTDDVVVTGIRVTAQDDLSEDDGGSGEPGETHLFGEAGYVLSIDGNPLVQYGTADSVAAQVGARVVGMRFRPFDASALGDPSIEAGDPVLVIDSAQRKYYSYLTSCTYKVGAYADLECAAESPSRNSADVYSASTKAIVDLRNAVKKEQTARQQAMDSLADKLAKSSGLYMTTELQDDGSTIYYMHDKPTLSESKVVWKLAAEALGISTDGGATYPYGLDVSGTAILDRIYAVGINADYIKTGTLSVVDDTGKTILRLGSDVETGLEVVSPYDDKTFLPLSWYAFSVKQGTMFSGAIKSWSFSNAMTDEYTVTRTWKFSTGFSGKVMITADFASDLYTFVSLDDSIDGSASAHLLLSSMLRVGSIFSWSFREQDAMATALSVPGNIVNITFGSDRSDTDMHHANIAELAPFTEYTITFTCSVSLNVRLQYGKLVDGSSALVTLGDIAVAVDQIV